MSTYENAPATKMLAVSCACCGEALVDSVSVETGVGPTCRKKHGYAEAQGEPNWGAVFAALRGCPVADLGLPCVGAGANEAAWRLGSVETRAVANKLVYLLAQEAGGADHGPAFVAALVNALKALGYEKLANRCAQRLATVFIWTDIDGALAVRAPYNEAFLAAGRRIPGRRWDGLAKVTKFAETAKPQVWAALCEAFPGCYGTGDKGTFIIPTSAVRKAA